MRTDVRRVVTSRFLIVTAVAASLFFVIAATSMAAAPRWKMLALTGPTYLPPKQSEIQKLIVEADGGTFQLGFQGEETAPIAFNASAATLESALEGLVTIGPGGVTVSGGPGGSAEHPYFVEFIGPLVEQDVEQLNPESAGLSGQNAGVHLFTPLQGGPGSGEIGIAPANIGGAPTAGEYTVQLGPLPPGIVLSATPHGLEWNCSGAPGDSSATCTSESEIPGLNAANSIIAPVKIEPSVATSGSTQVSISGAGAMSDSVNLPLVVSRQEAPNGAGAFWAGFFDENGDPYLQAGGHPYSAATYFLQTTVRSPTGKIITVGDPKDVIVDLPPGFVGDPLATPRCPQEQTAADYFTEYDICNYDMTVGRFVAATEEFGSVPKTFLSNFFNDVPAAGYAGQFTTKIGFPLQGLVASTRSSDDFGLRIHAENASVVARVYGAFSAFEGFPKGAKGAAFLRNPTSCGGAQTVTSLQSSTWPEPTIYSSPSESPFAPVAGCEKLKFTPSFSLSPSTSQGSSPSGATSSLHIPQAGLTDASQLAQPDLKKAVLDLPDGFTLNPSAANGLASCSLAQIGYVGLGAAPNRTRFSEAPVTCPDASKLGTVQIKTPILEEPLAGTIYLASQEENPFGSLVAIYLVVESSRFGVTLKLPGKIDLDSGSGRVTATFDDNPQIPFEDLTLSFRGGGPRSTFATPEVCGHHATSGTLEPWSAPQSGPPAQVQEGGFNVSTGCSSSAATRPFAPTFSAGSTSTRAGARGPLVINVNRRDGEQEMTSLDFTLPRGLLGKLAGIPYCSDASIKAAAAETGRAEQASPSCPASSQLGTVDAAAGVGPEPFHAGGKVYLAGPYRGASISAVVVTPAVAGPFDLGDVVIRTPLYIDPETAVITAKSDPIPTILRGIPLKLRSLAIDLDRPSFTLNPTSCDPAAVTAALSGSSGAIAKPQTRFQVGGCRKLRFKPHLSLSLSGAPTRRGGHPALRALLKTHKGESNISRASVLLPKTEFLENAHIRTVCTRVQYAADNCPKRSIYGFAKAWTPLLDKPLQGPVYLRSSNHLLPDLVASLDGQIHVDLDGRIDSVHSRVRNTFETVPDAPITKFELRMQGGPKGLLVNNTQLCKADPHATVKFVAHNAKAVQTAPRVRVAGCGTKHRRGSKKGHQAVEGK